MRIWYRPKAEEIASIPAPEEVKACIDYSWRRPLLLPQIASGEMNVSVEDGLK